MQTTLNLLTKDGAVYMTFSPALQATEYAKVLEISDDAADAEDLRQQLGQWAKSRGLRYSFDPLKDPS